MGKLLFIDSDDIETLSESLRKALEKRGIRFGHDPYGEFGYPTDDDDEQEEMYDTYFGQQTVGRRRHCCNVGCGHSSTGSCGGGASCGRNISYSGGLRC